MPDLNFSNPQGQTLTVSSPDGSVPSEQELDTMFSQKYGSESNKDTSNTDNNELSSFGNQQPPQNQQQSNNSSGNVGTDIAGDIARGFINSGAGTIDKINGVVKLLKSATDVDLGSEGLTNVSDKLKQLVSQQQQSSNPLISGAGQFVGSIPDAIGEFVGSGGGLGFIARSAALAAADAYNKIQTPTSLIKGAAFGGAVGAVLDKIPGALDGAAQLSKKWGQTAGKTYLQAVTGATDKEAQEMIDKLPEMDINPKNKIEDYNEAKDTSNEQIKNLKENNSNLLQQQKDQHTKEYETAKGISDDSVNSLVENNRDAIEDLRSNQIQNKESLNDATSTEMMANTDASTQKLAESTASTLLNIAKAKSSLENTMVSTFDTANKKIQDMTNIASEDVANAHASLENNNLDYVPTSIIKKELDSAIGVGNSKYFKNLSGKQSKESNSYLNKQIAPGVKVSDLPESQQTQFRPSVTNLGQIARSGNTADSLTAETGTGTGAVTKSINLINDTRNSLVDEFSNIGKTSLTAIEAQSTALEGAIDKGFNGQSVPKGLVTIMAKIKSSINPTKLFEKYPSDLSHLRPLAEANKAYSSQIDGLRNSLNLYKDNVDGNINPQKVFNALDRNDSAYIAKLKQADESLPKQDRIFDKVKESYDNYKNIEASEKLALSKTEKAISQQRLGLNKKFISMKKKLNVEQRQELISKIKETRDTKRIFSQQQSKYLKELHDKQSQTMDMLQVQKDKELGLLQESVNKRLHDLHLLHMARGTRAAATGNARIFQNVANYRSIDGMTTLNPSKMIQGSIISKLASPSGAANTIKGLLQLPEKIKGSKEIMGNKALKAILAAKLSGR